jgi:hypothetical protein
MRSAAHGSIGAAYAAIGTATEYPTIVNFFYNGTNGEVIFSTDGTNDKGILGPGDRFTVDYRTNAPTGSDTMLPAKTQFYVKDGPTAPSSGTFYIGSVEVRN